MHKSRFFWAKHEKVGIKKGLDAQKSQANIYIHNCITAHFLLLSCKKHQLFGILCKLQ